MSFRHISRRQQLIAYFGMAVTAGYAITRGIAYLPGFAPQEPPDALVYLTFFTGFTPWAIAWLISGLLCFVGMIRRDRIWSSMVAGIAIAWGGAYLVSWIRSVVLHLMMGIPGEINRDWLNAGSYLMPGFLLIVWITMHPGVKAVEEE